MEKMKANIAELKVDSKLLQESMIHLEQKVEENVQMSRKVLTIVEGFAGKVADLDQENKMGAITLRRHDTQIHELATATGTTISE